MPVQNLFLIIALTACNALYAQTPDNCPSISAQPSPTSIVYGSNASLSVMAGNVAVYQWQSSDNAGENWINIHNSPEYTGANSSTLVVHQPTVSLNGNLYRCVLTKPGCPDLISGIASLTVRKKPVTASFEVADKVYDGQPAAIISRTVIEGLIPGDEVSLQNAAASFPDKRAGFFRPVSINLDNAVLKGRDAENYHLSGLTQMNRPTASIIQRPLLVVIEASDKPYDGNVNASTIAKLSPVSFKFVEGDIVSVVSSNGRFENSNVGTNKNVTASIKPVGPDAANYLTIDRVTTTASITARIITATVTIGNKAYDGNTTAPINSIILNGILPGDDVSVTGIRAFFENKNAGFFKQVSVNLSNAVLTGLQSGNYQLQGFNTVLSTGSINRRPILIAIRAADKIFDGTTAAETTAMLSPNSIGFVAGDLVTFRSRNGAFENASVGANKTVTATITTEGDDAPNYIFNRTAETTASILAPLQEFSSTKPRINSISIGRSTDKAGITVYGNPSNSSFRIKLQSQQSSERVQVRIMTLQGRVLDRFQNLRNGQVLEFGQGYPAGTYIMEVVTGDTRRSERLVKQ